MLIAERTGLPTSLPVAVAHIGQLGIGRAMLAVKPWMISPGVVEVLVNKWSRLIPKDPSGAVTVDAT